MKKITIIISSILIALVIMSSGYGLWQKQLTIKGDIDVAPDPKVISSLESEIESNYRKIEEINNQILDLIEQKRIADEKAAEEARKLEEELKKNQEQNDVEGTDPTEDEDVDNDNVEDVIPDDTEDYFEQDSDTEVDYDVEDDYKEDSEAEADDSTSEDTEEPNNDL